MKIIVVLVLLFSHLPTWANAQKMDELGRSLANYQVCSLVSTAISDEQMFNYYQKMFNDTGLRVLSLNAQLASQVYVAWGKSEKLLLTIEKKSLQKICLSRFDGLSRKMLSKIITK